MPYLIMEKFSLTLRQDLKEACQGGKPADIELIVYPS
jgi:hypothetical protein